MDYKNEKNIFLKYVPNFSKIIASLAYQMNNVSMEFSCNTQSWQYFVKASDENKMEIDNSWIKFNIKLSLSWYTEQKLMQMITIIYFPI